MEYLADTVSGFDRQYSPEITVSGSEQPPQDMLEVMRYMFGLLKHFLQVGSNDGDIWHVWQLVPHESRNKGFTGSIAYPGVEYSGKQPNLPFASGNFSL